MPLHILLTGAAGQVGSKTLSHLLAEGHTVLATDISPTPPPAIPPSPQWSYVQADLCSLPAIDSLFAAKFDGVIHLGAIPNPRPNYDDRKLHANNVVGSYNVLRTAVDKGVKRIAQASSVNAHGLSYSIPQHVKFDYFPIDEAVERRDEDAYALSKHVCEIQADSLVRLDPSVRIASLRFHMVRDDYASAVPDCTARDLWSWVSYSAVARACLLAITSERWSGAEVFNVVAPEICYEGTLEKQASEVHKDKDKVPTLELVKRYCAYKPQVHAAYFDKNPSAALWTCAKAEKLLGWKHDM